MTDHIMEMWTQLAIEIGQKIYRSVNTRETVGTDSETGYILMFFDASSDDDKSTFVSSETDINRLKKLLKRAAKELDRAKTIGPEREQ